MGRHRGGRGFKGFRAGWSGAGGFGHGHFRTGRKLGSDDLQLVILALLADRPSHGYELIKLLEERSGGFYSPSPGMVYPALTYLEEIGYATVAAEGAKKLYQVTEEGRSYLAQNRAAVDATLAELERIGQKMGDVRRAFAGEDQPGDDAAEGSRHPDGLRRARRELRRALDDKAHSSPDEASRIADILRRATAEILRGR
ncbi:MAG TPA: PadR family transcriptional regulator [Xanthobacteraceae bacterium]|nr:PadR family transcriptional regulator [Xanthobacteraceae bacterium]